jgi:REP element-mobilizing transposase RayT
LGDVVGAFKSISTDQYIIGVKQDHWPAFPGKLWHRNYYEHIIRDEESLNRIRKYVADNPAEWAEDRENPNAFCRKTEESWQV